MMARRATRRFCSLFAAQWGGGLLHFYYFQLVTEVTTRTIKFVNWAILRPADCVTIFEGRKPCGDTSTSGEKTSAEKRSGEIARCSAPRAARDAAVKKTTPLHAAN